ncbi:YidB family protein [Turneriella parva]|nr:YidB family protein [Turneriella parva]
MSLMETLGGLASQLSGEGSDSELLTLAKDLLSKGGSGSNVESILGALKEGGYADTISSWIGNGENQSITGAAIKKVLGSDAIADIAEKTGLSQSELPALLADLMPLLVNKATPDGQEPGGGLLAAGASILKGLL